MTKHERWELYENAELRQMVAIELLDWAGYWSGPGVIDAEIPDELLRRQTRQAVKMILEDISYCIKIVTGLLVTYQVIIDTPFEDITDVIVHGVVVNIMATRLEWLVGE